MGNKKWYAPARKPLLLFRSSLVDSYLGAFANNINPANKSYELFIPWKQKWPLFWFLKSKHILINQTSFIAACRLMGFNDEQIKEKVIMYVAKGRHE